MFSGESVVRKSAREKEGRGNGEAREEAKMLQGTIKGKLLPDRLLSKEAKMLSSEPTMVRRVLGVVHRKLL